MRAWDGMDAFVEVIRMGSFSAAARSLGLSTAFVSRAVSGLEHRLGTQLLHRTTRKLGLTDAGRLYYEHARQLLEGFDAAEQAIVEFQEGLRGNLRISLATTYGERYVAPLVNQFLARHPQIGVDMDFSNRNVNLIEEGYDLAVRTGLLEDSNLVARRLGERRLFVVGSPAYLNASPAPVDLDALDRHTCLLGSSSHWIFAEHGQPTQRPVRGRYRAASGQALLDAALRGLGLAQLPDFYVESPLLHGQLVSVLDAYRYEHGAVWLVYPRSRHLSPKVRQLADFLIEGLQSPPWKGLDS
ncbi:DNA-binding transcriptional LysR family regulator [Luteibacter sp. Sphag1AF]|uniref:LysR substrate-binding domain-containing protein n=1 Tax=Luteibacter sp. Sphag1AF TaxID=2587031 RepID=UPI00160B9DD0|nr:LysR substrate-binding domain-containing protein [Luteibacter sp. Sphag1AF]MBB3228488.1 DNA-binding transcriptional LysR family regulator [Luteibacter sp. Sphag1AF]